MPVLSQFSKFAEHSDYLLDLPQTSAYSQAILKWLKYLPVVSQFGKVAEHFDYLLDPPQTSV